MDRFLEVIKDPFWWEKLQIIFLVTHRWAWHKRKATVSCPSIRVSQSLSDQISSSVVSDSLRPHESQHARPPCPSPTPRVHQDSHPSSQWCHPAISQSTTLPQVNSFLKGASLVAQWLRVCLPVQWTREDPTCCGEPKTMDNYWSLLKPRCLESVLSTRTSHLSEKPASCNGE